MRDWELREFGVQVILTIPNMAGTSPDLACNHTDTRSSQSNHASHTPDFTYPHLSSISFSSSFPISLFLVHNSTIIAEYKVKSSLSMPWSWVDTEYCIHRVQNPPSTGSNQNCLSSLHSHDYELTPECSFIFRRSSLHDRPPSAKLSIGALMWSHIVTFPRSRVKYLMNRI